MLTERDQVWIEWVGRWRAVTAEQIAQRFVPELPSGVKVAERRVRVWRELGLVDSVRVLAGVPAVHTLRGPGMRLVGLEGPIRRPIVGQLRHDLAVVDLAVWLQRDQGVRLITEREIRAADGPREPRPRLALHAAAGSGRQLVFPDLISVEETGRGRRAVAHEVELTGKEHARLVALMKSYVAAQKIDGVRYYVPDALRRRVDKAAAEVIRWARETKMGVTGPKVSVTGWDWTLTPQRQSGAGARDE